MFTDCPIPGNVHPSGRFHIDAVGPASHRLFINNSSCLGSAAATIRHALMLQLSFESCHGGGQRRGDTIVGRLSACSHVFNKLSEHVRTEAKKCGITSQNALRM